MDESTPRRQPKTFDASKPGREITDPENEGLKGGQEFPRHMHDPDEPGASIIVYDEDEKAAALADGYKLEPTATKPSKAPTRAAQTAAARKRDQRMAGQQ